VTAPIGSQIQILPKEGVPNYHKISYCTFKNNPGEGGDYGNEPIRIGLGAVSNFPSRTVVEYCYWYNTGLADSESISIKSMENVIRYNVFDNNNGGALVFRNGDRNIAYGNIFLRGSGGIRVKEANDILCFNNYFDSINASKNFALSFDYLSPNLKNIHFIHNFFYDSNIDIEQLTSSRKDTSIYFINNMFYRTPDTPLFYAEEKSITLSNVANFSNNIFDTSDDFVTGDKTLLDNNNNNSVK
jgi:hypothetical protein